MALGAPVNVIVALTGIVLALPTLIASASAASSSVRL
jgi:hypothetical protein